MDKPEFTAQEAQFLIDAASSAPLRNLQHARQLDQTIARFSQWYNAVSKAEVPGAEGAAS